MRLFICVKWVDCFSTGKLNYIARTNTNPNNESYRYQLVVRGNNAKTIGIYLIDSGLLKRVKIAHDLFIPADFTSNYLVLSLASVDTINYILLLDFPDPYSKTILICTLLLMKLHLSFVNTNGRLTAKKRIYMLWSSYPFLLHVDKVSITTKSNCTY